MRCIVTRSSWTPLSCDQCCTKSKKQDQFSEEAQQLPPHLVDAAVVQVDVDGLQFSGLQLWCIIVLVQNDEFEVIGPQFGDRRRVRAHYQTADVKRYRRRLFSIEAAPDHHLTLVVHPDIFQLCRPYHVSTTEWCVPTSNTPIFA